MKSMEICLGVREEGGRRSKGEIKMRDDEG